MQARNNQPTTRGFTLVEIMIVVGIIGLLATIAIPNYLGSRRKAQQTACIVNLEQIEGAMQQWAMELNKDAGQTVTFADLRPYLRRSGVCPAGGTCFEDSYTISSVDQPPVCQRLPSTHKLPE